MWPQILRLLQSNGYSQSKLAELVGVDQSTICRLADGRAPEPRYSVGEALIDLAGGRLALAEQGIVQATAADTSITTTEPATAGAN